MKNLLKICIKYYRATLSLFGFFIISGFFTYINMPKEAAPDVKIPVAVITVSHSGISPENAEILIAQPIEKKLQTISGIKSIQTETFEGGCSITTNFNAGLNVKQTIRNVKEKVEEAEHDLPKDSDKPIITEINPSLFPVLNIHVLGEVPLRALYKLVDSLSDAIESNVSQVLEVKVSGKRKEELQIIIDPITLQSYHINPQNLIAKVINNHKLISIGEILNTNGEISIKMLGLIKHAKDLLEMPIISTKDQVIKFKDVAKLQRVYKEPTSLSRFNGKRAVTLQVIKRVGKNILATVLKTKKVVAEFQKQSPSNIQIIFSGDQAKKVKNTLNDLVNNLIMAVLIVMLVVFWAMGWKAAILIGLSIPASFLCGIWIINFLGCTINIVVLFGLILAVGMLVDGAIIVVEDADRHIIDGQDGQSAFINAGNRMFIPVLTSIATTLVVFLPLLFWPGVTGKFMQFLPITLLATLGSSLVVATILIPIIGSFINKKTVVNKNSVIVKNILAIDGGNFKEIGGFTGQYVKLLTKALHHPIKIVIGSILLMIMIMFLYSKFGKGVEFFVDIEPENLFLKIKAKDQLSIYQKESIIDALSTKLQKIQDIENVSTNAFTGSKDIIGDISINFVEWNKRKKSFSYIYKQINHIIQSEPGVVVEMNLPRAGPPRNKPIEINISNINSNKAKETTKLILQKLMHDPQLTDIESTITKNGLELIYQINRAQADKFQLNVLAIGNTIKLATTGIKINSYNPKDANDSINIVLKFHKKYCTINQIDNLKLYTPSGLIPLSLLTSKTYQQKSPSITRISGNRAEIIKANVANGVIINEKIGDLKKLFALDKSLQQDSKIEFKGENEDKQESANFGIKAFIISLALIAIILVMQFNSFFEMFLVLSAVVMSISGVLIGLLVTNQPFSIVMCGIIGMVALSGIIVGNNILMIDTYKRYKDQTPDIYTLLIMTGAQRLRAIVLTQLTTSLGLIPIVLKLSIDFTSGYILYDAPSNQWWRPLSTCIVFGILFASPMTLFFTPCALLLKEKTAQYIKKILNFS